MVDDGRHDQAGEHHGHGEAGEEHGEGHGHGHVKLSRFAKVLLFMECPYGMYSYNFRYMMGVKGSFYSVFHPDADKWVFYTNIGIFVASLLAVVLAVVTDSYFRKYTILVLGYLLSFVSCLLLFAVAIFKTGKYEQLLNTVGLFWGLLFITIEPLRVAVFFDQLPNKMDAHTTFHVFIFYQEMKTLGSILYTGLSKLIYVKVYGKTPISLAILYFAIPFTYGIIIIAFWKVSKPGESSYMIGIDCITCFVRAFHLKFFKRVKQEGHWLDTARDAYDAKTVRSTKIMCSLIFVFITLVSYGMAVFLQKNSWVDQSQNLIEDLFLKKYYGDINMIFFVLTLVGVPFIEYFFLPQIYKRRKDGKWFTELQRIGITVFLTGAAFVSTTTVQLEIEKHSSLFPSGSRAQVRIFNVQEEEVWVSGDWVFEETNISATNMIQAWNVKSLQTSLYTIRVKSKRFNFTSLLGVHQGESVSYTVGRHELLRVYGYDPIVFGPQGTNVPDMVRVYFINYKVMDDGTLINMMNPGDEMTLNLVGEPSTPDPKAHHSIKVIIPDPFNRTVFQVYPGEYELVCPKEKMNVVTYGSCVNGNATIKRGGIYAVLPLKKDTRIEQHQVFKVYTICNPAYYSVYLMLPQIVLQAFAIAMGKVPINVFLFKESPVETRVSTLALYYFSQDGSSIIFAIFHNVFRFRVDSFQLVLVTGVHLVFCFFFTFAALKHQKFPEDDGMRRRRALIGSG